MRSLSTWLLLVSFVCCVIGPARAEDWWRFRGPNCDGISSESDWTHQWPAEGPAVQWTAEVGTGFSTIVTSDGRVYTMGNRNNIDTVYCLDGATGTELWSHDYECPTDPNEFEGGPTATPTVDGNRVYTLSRRGEVFAFEKATGEVLWSKNVAVEAGMRVPGWGFSGAPLVINDTLLLNIGDAGVAVKKDSGDILWASEDRDSGYSGAVPIQVDGVDCVILGSSRSYVCVEIATGKERWRQRWLTTFGCNAADAIVSDGRVFLSSAYNRGSALIDPSGGEPEVIWKHKDYANHLTTSVLIDGFLYGVNGDVDAGATLTCMEWSSGKVAWQAESLRAGALTASGNRLIVITDSGELVIALAESTGFQPLARHQVLDGRCWSAPVLSNGRIHCRNAAGRLVCLNVKP